MIPFALKNGSATLNDLITASVTRHGEDFSRGTSSPSISGWLEEGRRDASCRKAGELALRTRKAPLSKSAARRGLPQGSSVRSTSSRMEALSTHACFNASPTCSSSLYLPKSATFPGTAADDAIPISVEGLMPKTTRPLCTRVRNSEILSWTVQDMSSRRWRWRSNLGFPTALIRPQHSYPSRSAVLNKLSRIEQWMPGAHSMGPHLGPFVGGKCVNR